MYKHSSLLLAAAAILHHTNAGLVWSVPNGITMPIARRYSTQDLIFDLRKGRSPQYIDTIGCKDFLVNPTLYNREVGGWDDDLDFSQFDGSTVAQLPAGNNLKQYHPNCYTASYSSDNPLIGRDSQPPDYSNLDFLNNANPFPVGGTGTDPWADLNVPNIGTHLEADNSNTETTGAHDTPRPGQNPITSAQTDVPAPLQDTLVVPGGQDIKLPSPGTDYTNTPYNSAYDTTLPNQGTDVSNSTPNNPSFEQRLDNAQYVLSPFPTLSSLHSQKPGMKLTLIVICDTEYQISHAISPK